MKCLFYFGFFGEGLGMDAVEGNGFVLTRVVSGDILYKTWKCKGSRKGFRKY